MHKKGLFRAWRGLTWTRTSGFFGVALCGRLSYSSSSPSRCSSVLDLRSFVGMWLELLVEYIFRWEVCLRYDL